MATSTRIRTLNFLPEVFQTPTNAQFLAATLDVLVDQPNTKKIEGYVGSKFGYGINAKDYYVTEPTKTRTDYQLEPGVVFTKPNETVAQDFISYPGILDALSIEGGNVTNNNSLFEGQFYSWDSFTNLDKLINFNQYYWLPEGPESVVVSSEAVYKTNDYIITDNPAFYTFSTVFGQSLGNNPTLTLLRGGTYTFAVNQDSQFWIQGEPGVTGYSIAQPNIQTRDVLGVSNNGATQGIVTFQVPFKNAQDEYNFPGNNPVDVISSLPFDAVNGQPVNGFAGIDGVTSLDGLRVLFYNTGVPNEQGYTSQYFGEQNYDQNINLVAPATISVTATTAGTNRVTCNSTASMFQGQTITFDGVDFGGLQSYQSSGIIYYVDTIVNSTQFTLKRVIAGFVNPQPVVLTSASGSMTGNINQGLNEEGYYSVVNSNFYRIQYVGDPTSPVIRLVLDGSVPTNQKITANYGTTYINRSFFKNSNGEIQIIPYLSAPLDILYYQDGTTPGKVGVIRLIESNITNTLDIDKNVLGKKNFTSTNGVKFTNGLKVSFQGDVIPSSYLEGEYYVEGVGTAIELIPTTELVVPEPFTESTFIPWDDSPWDMTAWEGNSFIPVTPDYITIARNSINRNAWSRSNRWFHINVINATAEYTGNPNLVSLYATPNNKAKRPIIEFYPNLKLYNSGTIGKNPIDFIDFRTTDAFSLVAGQQNYYPDVQVYSTYTATIATTNYTQNRTITNTSATGNTVTVNSTTGFRVNDIIVLDAPFSIGGLTYFTNYYVAEVVNSTTIKVSETKNGPVKTLSTASGTITAKWYPMSTIVTVAANAITGSISEGLFITDSTNVLPRNSFIESITGTTTLSILVSWDEGTDGFFNGATNSSIVATVTTVDNFSLFDGARVVFAADTDENVRNKIYVSRFAQITPTSPLTIVLTEAQNGQVLINDQLAVYRGYNYQGKDFWFDGVEWITGQQKITVNQAPLFDVFDDQGISFGNKEFYTGSSFKGNRLFSYGIGSGLDDSILGFPLKYSNVDNVGDISFDVSLNSATFDYVRNTNPITQKVNTGYVHNCISREEFVRNLGWQTAVAPSTQYQLFSFNYVAGNPVVFTCDIPATVATNPEEVWPSVQVYVNNKLVPSSDYTVAITNNSTVVTLADLLLSDTVVQILIISDQTSANAYYTIPTNLNNNPLNQELTSVNVGDIRGQYQSIFYNNPDTRGEVFGANNYQDLGNLVPWGNRIIQNSASLALPGALLRKQSHNLFNSLTFNSREYIKYKTLIVDTVEKIGTQRTFDPSLLLDQTLDYITASKSQEQPFFWSDMLPSKAAFITNTYSFANNLDVSVYPLSKVYDFKTANYNGVLVYLTRVVNANPVVTQLIKGQDYTVSDTSPSLTVTIALEAGDLVTIKEYNQTYGSYCPNTPTKLGLYPATIPEIILDPNYFSPTYFILGHDGSYNKLYGEYDPTTGLLEDFRDQVLLEFETRVYNNLKLSGIIPISQFEVLPGYFRSTSEEWKKFTSIYQTTFLDWVGTNRVDYKTQVYNNNNEFTYNYRDSGNKLNNTPLLQGYWRGLYQYFYDTTNPDTMPWQMLGYTNKPDYWDARYGPAPYTSDNLVLWQDLAEGLDYSDPELPVVIPSAVRPGLLNVLPVDSNGDLVSPFVSLVGNYVGTTFRNDWRVGDMGPTELSYRRSSSWPFDLMRIMALAKPAKFYNYAVDLDNYKYNLEFDQFLVNDRSRLILSDIQVYGTGVAKTSYLNWIVDYEKQLGVNATQNLETLFANTDVRLVYRLAGFSDKTLLKFYVEKGTPNSRNASLLIPDESYQVLLYDNQPFEKLVYSGVVIQIVPTGFAIYGNAQNRAYFTALPPKYNTQSQTLTIEDLTVQIATDFYDIPITVPYGTVFKTIQELITFILGYGEYLKTTGMVFDSIENGIEINWQQMCAEILYWAQTGWDIGSIITINPSAKDFKVDRDGYVVQPMTITNTNFVLNENLYPIQSKDLSVLRDGTLFNIKPLNQGDSIGYGQFNIGNIEHGIVFNNVTLFGDIIYNLVTGLRQNRITLRGTKTADWNGTVTTSGFILNQDNITEWNRETKYTKGAIVKFKNKYWTALKLIEAKETFDERDWKRTDYDQIQKGLLPNPSTRAYESTLYYNVDQANLEQDADLLSFSLIGYRPRDYLALADLTDITQINVYKNMIKNKGTLNAASAFKGANLPQGGIDYEIYENWAIKSAEYGGVLNSNFVEFKLNEQKLTGNPGIVGLTDGVSIPGVQQEVPIYSLFNYARPISDVNIMPTVPSVEPSLLFPDAGYVNFNDVKLSSFYYSQLPVGVNKNNIIVPINQVYVRDYIWLANYLGTWQVYTPNSLGQVISAKNNLNNTVTITFAEPHNLSQYDPLMIVNFDVAVNGYYIAVLVVDPYNVVINLVLDQNIKTLTGNGIGMGLQTQRVARPSDINSLPLLDSEFRKNKVWVDENNDGGWAVYRKSINYKLEDEIVRQSGLTFGSGVAYTNNLGYLITDASTGAAYRYTYNALLQQYELLQTITNGSSFGAALTYSDNFVAISEPTSGTPKVYIYELVISNLTNSLNLHQTAIAAQGGSVNWGSSLAISGDENWLYISATDLNRVYVYRKSQLTGEFEYASYFTVAGLVSGDQFGFSIATDYYGDSIIVSAPYKDSTSGLENYGYAYVFNRAQQTFEVQYNTTSPATQEFTLAYTPPQGAARSSTQTTTTEIICNASMTGFTVDMPVMFQGSNFGSTGINPNVTYYIAGISGNNISIKASRTGSAIALAAESGLSFNVYVQTTPLFVSVNGSLVPDSNYAIANNKFVYNQPLNAGDIIVVSGQEIILTQTLSTTVAPKTGVTFGHSLDTNRYASEIIIGAPFNLDENNSEGAVYRFTNAGAKFGTVVSSDNVNVTTNRNILINGYLVTIPAGNATVAANAINSANVPNVTASAFNELLTISLVNGDLSAANEKLLIVALDSATYAELGLKIYYSTQVVKCPHKVGPTQFGYTVKFNEFDSFVASAPVGIRYEATTFDFSDDELDNDTVFDNNSTQFIDTAPNAGAVYMFDYIPNYNESLSNMGLFVYAQSTNDISVDYGAQPYYGTALDYNNNRVVVGTPAYRPGFDNGKVITFVNNTNKQDWAVYRNSAPIVDIHRINNSQIFSAETNNTLVNLDYIDPLQGKILGAARENIDVISNIDPARYNNNGNIETSTVWGAEHIGEIWLNTSAMRYVNYHQDDLVYNSQYWGTLFPNSDVAVYTWISSTSLPNAYTGPGTPFDVTKYTIQYNLSSNGSLIPVYYYWVRNTNVVFNRVGKSLSDTVIETYVKNPKASGISYFAPLLPSVFGLYNCQNYIDANNSVFHISYATGMNDDVTHNQYTLIRSNYADDFLPGLPSDVTNPISVSHGNFNLINGGTPTGLYARLLDSLSGTNDAGGVVPDPKLPKAVQNGILARPRQSFFVNRLVGLENLVQFMNSIYKQFPFYEITNSKFLFGEGAINPSTVDNPDWDGSVLPFYDTANYVQSINWWAPGYDDNTKSNIQVPLYSDLEKLNVPVGTIATVNMNGNGLQETYIYQQDGSWLRIGLQNGTIQIKDSIYDYAGTNVGFGNNFWDTDPFDAYPSEETRNITRAFCEELPSELLIARNRALILLFEYIQSETIENQNYLPWLNKTSLVDVQHTIRELLPFEVFKSDNQDFLSGYLNEIKPYHVLIKEFAFTYKGNEIFEGDITDFDLPAKYDSNYEVFVSPQLVYQNAGNEYQYTPSSQIWSDGAYSQWYNNYGLELAGINNYPITTLASYIATNTDAFVVDNASGFPINGVIRIASSDNSYEDIGYNSVDYNLNIISGLSRGLNGTLISTHIPGTPIAIDLPPVVVTNSGRGYVNPPKVTVVVDPLASQTAKFVGSITGTTLTVTSVTSGQIILNNYLDNPALALGTQVVSKNIDGTYEVNISQTVSSSEFISYVGPREPAILQPIMGLDSVLGVEVINPGSGYATQPEIIIEPAFSVTFANYNVNVTTNTIRIYAPTLATGDLIQYKVGLNSTPIGGLKDGQTYYVNVLESSPLIVIGFYTSYGDAINDHNRIEFYNTGTGTNHSINLGAFAYALTDSKPVRENITTLRFDRTSYNSRVVDWEAGRFYGAYYAGRFVNTETLSSSAINLFSTNPPIENVLASSQGVTFEILDVANERVIDFDSVARNIVSTSATGNRINLQILPETHQPTASASTIGFYLGMPIKFIGAVGSTGLDNDRIYYVAEIVNYTTFTVATDQNNLSGSVVTLATATIGAAGLLAYPGKLTDTALITVDYPGISNVTATNGTTNKLTIPLNATGSGGTNNFYPGLPIFFTSSAAGNVFGGVVANDMYYVTTVCDKQTFTMSTNSDPTILTVLETDSTLDTVIISEVTDSLEVDDQVIFTNFKFEVDQMVNGQEYTINYIGTTDFTLLGAESNTLGLAFTYNGVSATGTGLVKSNYWSNIEAGVTYYVSEVTGIHSFKITTAINTSSLNIADSLVGTGNVTNQNITYDLTTATGNMVININLPVSPGQVNGQEFTLYQTGNVSAPITTNSTQVNQDSLVLRDIEATVTVGSGVYSPGYVALNNLTGGLTNIYKRMPVVVNEDFGNLSSSTTYFVESTGTVEVDCTATNISTKALVVGYITNVANVPVLHVTAVTSGTVQIGAAIGGTGIIAGTKISAFKSGTLGGIGEYYIDTEQTASSTNITVYTGYITCTSTAPLFINMPIVFSGVGLGGIDIDLEYYVASILNSTDFTITNTPNGTETVVTTSSGSMTGTGLPYVKLATTSGGAAINPGKTQVTCTIAAGSYPGDAVITITSPDFNPANGTKVFFKTDGTMPSGLAENDVYYVVNSSGAGAGGTFKVSPDLGGTPVSIANAGTGPFTVIIADDLTLTQEILTYPVVNVSYILGGYRVAISGTNPGSGWAIDNQIVIPGNLLGGTTPANDLTLQVNEINELVADPFESNGKIVKFICSGTVPGSDQSYYLKVVNPNTFAVFSNSLMTIPVSGINFGYDGIVSSTATATNTSDEVTVANLTGFSLRDPIVFTGTVFGGIVLGRTYYIKTINTGTGKITLSAVPDGSVIQLSNASGSMTIAKVGDYALLPQPFYFDPSIVKFNGKAWECVVSNNDTDFILGKWKELQSGDRQLNALDRIKVYYAPTDNMPGVDIPQLVSNVRYPNSQYLGNPFAPGEQFPIDTILPVTAFYPTQINLRSVAYNERFYAALNTGTYSGVGLSAIPSGPWDIQTLANSVVNLTDIIYAGGYYIITSQNPATPIFRSDNGVDWSSNGYYTPYGRNPYDTIPFDQTALNASTLFLNSVTYGNGYFVAAGQNILRSSDTYGWTEVYRFTNGLTNQFNGVSYINNGSFNGFVAVGKGQRYDYSGPLSQVVDTNVIVVSTNNFNNWSDLNSQSYFGLNAVTGNNSLLVAAGENGIIYVSQNGATWSGVTEVVVLGTNGITNTVTVQSVAYLTNGERVRFTGTAFGNIQNDVDYYIGNIDTGNNTVQLYTDSGLTTLLTLATGSPQGLATLYKPGLTINDLFYDTFNSIFVAVGNSGLIRTSSNGIVWTTRTSGTTENLYGISSNGAGKLMVVGDNNKILVSTNAGVTWTLDNTFVTLEPEYNIVGDPFTAGYGPEELVPGVVTDSVTMTVATRPGTNWPATLYGHVGYNVVSLELTPTSGIQTEYSFDGAVQVPFQIFVAIIDPTTGLSTTIYEPTSYTTDWINNTITLSTPLSLTQKLRIDVYEAGNGDQLVKSNTKNNPIRTNTVTGWNEIYLNCNYTGSQFQGSGVVQVDSGPKSVEVIATEAGTNTITCIDVKHFNLNDPITFQGAVFGGLAEDTTYYVKTISPVSKTITVSLVYNISTGTAGATYAVSDAVGSCYAIINIGEGTPFTNPLMYHNGVALIHGTTGTVTRTKSATNSIQVNTTAGMIVNTPIVFSDTMFGNVIQPQTTYYIKSIVDPNEFTISTTPGGAVLTLTDSTGGAEFVTNDYAFDIQPNGIQAKLVLAASYDSTVDYLCYTVFGETSPQQYGYTIPEAQIITSTGAASYSLVNYISTDSITNAVVEVNGLRQFSGYTINNSTNTITFASPPTAGAVITVTTYNLTERQYLDTDYTTIPAGKTVANIIAVSNTISPVLAQTNVSASTAGTNLFTCADTTGFVIGQTIQFKVSSGGSAFGGVAVDGTTYYIDSIPSSTQFTIKDENGTQIALTTAAGFMVAYVGGQPAVRVTTGVNHLLAQNDLVRIDGTTGSIQLNNNLFYVNVINSTQFDLYQTQYDPLVNAINIPITSVNSYTGGGYCWEEGLFNLITVTASDTTAVSNVITLASGNTTDSLTVNTPIYFTEGNKQNGETTLGGLIIGQRYYIKEIVSTANDEFTISATYEGDEVVLTTATGSMGCTQWEQLNPDRLWVTVNGYRVPSSKLVLNPGNRLSILTTIVPGDEVIITSMIPTATPNEEVFFINVNKDNEGSVYRVNGQNTTWLTEDFYNTDATMCIQDARDITTELTQNSTAPLAVDGYRKIGLSADKNQITYVGVYNNTKSAALSSSSYTVVIEGLAPILKITDGAYISTNDSLTITILEGNTVFINGEQIQFTSVDLANNELQGLIRGVNGTGQQEFIPQYTEVYGILQSDRMTDVNYASVWNPIPGVYNTTSGDPLQIADTPAAIFLRQSQ